MKKMTLLALAAVMALGLTACGGSSSKSYADGTYTGQSAMYYAADFATEDDDESDDTANGYGEVVITIKDGAIAECTFATYEEDGTLKGEDYGMQDGEIKNRDYYNKAQKANAARDEYAAQLVEAGSAKDVDCISGATINYNEFLDAVDAALEQAEQ